MGTMFWIIIILLALNAFLIMLNVFLRGAWKIYIDCVLGLFQVTLLILMFIFYGWRVGLLSFLGCFVFGAVAISPAAFIASKLLHHN